MGEERDCPSIELKKNSVRWTEGLEKVTAEAIKFFQNQFSVETHNVDLSMIKEIHTLLQRQIIRC